MGDRGCSGDMKEVKDSLEISHTFQNLVIKKIDRTDTKGTEGSCVMDEKFSLIFWAEFEIHDRNKMSMTYRLWRMSLPIVVIVHGSQETKAWATIFWDNAFGEMNRKMFKVTHYTPKLFKKVCEGEKSRKEVTFLHWQVISFQLCHQQHLCVSCMTW